MRAREAGALAALGLIGVITASWWGFALWPLPDAAPAWLLRTRAICFGAAARGLPDAAGWIALVGQPALMLALLFVIWGDAVRDGVRATARTATGRAVVGTLAFLLTGALALAGARAASSPLGPRSDLTPRPPLRIAERGSEAVRKAPALDLVDQRGERLTVERFHGRPLLVTFAYAHCETVCPLVVAEVLAAQRAVSGRPTAPAVVIVTLDPWRDTPERLPSIAMRWRLAGGAFVASGSVAAVEAALDRWRVARSRDPRTGQITHPTPVYVVDGGGRLVYVTSGGTPALVELLSDM